MNVTQDSILNGKTFFMLACHPGCDKLQETLNTLDFGKRVKEIRVRAEKNTDAPSIVTELKEKIKRLEAELDLVRNSSRGAGGPVGPTLNDTTQHVINYILDDLLAVRKLVSKTWHTFLVQGVDFTLTLPQEDYKDIWEAKEVEGEEDEAAELD
jgi:hypothetical protein